MNEDFEENNTDRQKTSTWSFWRNLAVYFCIFSVIGHWLEILYCSFMDIFGIVADDSLVWDDPMYPFLVYGIGVVVCVVALVPLRKGLAKRCKSSGCTVLSFYLITVLVCMLMELIMGLLLNQPNHIGEYPLWDNSELPLNILNQAWLINDLALGAVAMLYTWFVYPLSERLLARIPPRLLNVIAVVIVVGFIVLCVVKFQS